MYIRKFKKTDAKPVWKLVSKVFSEFVKKDFTKKGIKKFLEKQSPEKNIERSKKRDVFVAIENNKLIGMIEGNRKDKVTRLFVDKKYHRKGIATELMKKIENEYKKKSKKIRVFSSLYAVGFYNRMGYKKSSGLVRRKEGVVYQPMIKVLK